MSAQDRLDEIQARANAATDGPWKIETHYGMSQSRRRQIVVPGWMTPIAVLGQENPYGDPDAEFIAHARTDVPRLVSALRAVLDLHKPMRMYEHEDSCGDESEEHREERHCEGSETIGEYFCLDLPTGITLCAECSRDLDFDGRDYPCPTVRAVESALGGAA